jgi:hypothetical protein
VGFAKRPWRVEHLEALRNTYDEDQSGAYGAIEEVRRRYNAMRFWLCSVSLRSPLSPALWPGKATIAVLGVVGSPANRLSGDEETPRKAQPSALPAV